MDRLLQPVVGDNGQETFCVEMMKRLKIQRRNEHLCDVILEVGSGDHQARLKVVWNVVVVQLELHVFRIGRAKTLTKVVCCSC